MNNHVTIENVSFAFPEKKDSPVLANVSLKVQQGEFVSLIGSSGSGKSTLFKLLAGLHEPTVGTIDIADVPHGQRLGRVAYMPQKDLLLSWRTVMENCMVPAELAPGRQDKDKLRANILAGLARFGLSGYEQAYPDELSGGMRQRVAFLRTLLTGGQLMLLDEPFGALDALTKREMHRWLLELWEGIGQTVLFITHDIEEALLLSDRIILLTPGGQGQQLREMTVPLPRPRHSNMIYEPALVQMRQQLEEQLHAKR
ncbi:MULTISPECIES: ABC transporter ATP-binding protein [Paenibacillus]|uniref:ABC transporter ATP-binding protein n=1 Tax=Paenibacillus TaxID=44249 RepID=UPI00209FFADA|nr:ABC transporter ATP-binding protein [Paenibacillus xylanexedens]MCP1424799.1 putative hydroxymethylpyrimidine transport system ATP-binding protein [Paenibacillus xylanexedens]